jgi:hypothetical protein
MTPVVVVPKTFTSQVCHKVCHKCEKKFVTNSQNYKLSTLELIDF